MNEHNGQKHNNGQQFVAFCLLERFYISSILRRSCIAFENTAEVNWMLVFNLLL